MLMGVERLVNLTETRIAGLSTHGPNEICEAVRTADLNLLASTDGHFAAAARDGQTVRMARTIGLPLRYFVAKMFHGPFLVVGERIDQIFEWCQSQKIGWQFDPLYTRMIPAHYLVEIDQIGCPDPAPRYHRFFNPPVAEGATNIEELGACYIGAAYNGLKRWLDAIPSDSDIGVAFSGGVDSTSVFLLAHQAQIDLGRDPKRLRAFTLNLGGGKDAEQAKSVMSALGLSDQLEIVNVQADDFNPALAISVIEDYHPLDIECAAASLCLLKAVRERYPSLKYILDGDGGDENLKDYPLEDSDLTLSSILRNPMLYQEGWGIDAIKNSLTYSGGLSRSYARTYAPARKYGFEGFSPYTTRAAIAAAVNIPFEQVLDGSVDRLYTLKEDVTATGVKRIIGVDMPVHHKRRFQDGAGGDSFRKWKVSKAWCRQVFLRQWEDRLREAWNPEGDRISGNVVPDAIASGR